MRTVLRIADIDGQQSHDVVLDGSAPIPDADDYITFEVRPGEWITRHVSGRRGLRYSADGVIVELEVDSLDDDEEAP